MNEMIIQTLTKSLRILWENAPTEDKIIILEKLKEEIDKKLSELYGNNGG
jgi:hypothetical protein